MIYLRLPHNIGRVREVAVRAARPGWRGGSPAAAAPKAISAKGRRLAAANTLLYEDATLLQLSKEKDVKWFDQTKE